MLARLVSERICEACETFETSVHPSDIARSLSKSLFSFKLHPCNSEDDDGENEERLNEKKKLPIHYPRKIEWELRRLPEEFQHFYAVRPPPITIREYCKRLRTIYDEVGQICSDEAWIVALILLDRFLGAFPHCSISDYSANRLLVAHMLIASKLHDDKYHSNRTWAVMAGVSLLDMNRMERFVFLKLCEIEKGVCDPTAFEFRRYVSFLKHRYPSAVGERHSTIQ